MKINNLEDLNIFFYTARHGSLTGAANHLSISPAVASNALKRLERSLGVLLFNRTTRSLKLTAEGQKLLEQGVPLFDGIQSLAEEVMSGRQALQGQLQLSMPSDLGRNLIFPWVDEFLENHPKVEIRLQLSDRIADFFRQPVDVAIRYGISPDSTLVALPLKENNRRILCAAPSYLRRYGHPQHPNELANHNCLRLMVADKIYNEWTFEKNNEKTSVHVKGDRMSDDSDAIRRWALQGKGICYRSTLDVASAIQSGELIAVCEEWQGDFLPLFMMCANRRMLSPMLRALRSFFQDKINAIDP